MAGFRGSEAEEAYKPDLFQSAAESGFSLSVRTLHIPRSGHSLTSLPVMRGMTAAVIKMPYYQYRAREKVG